MTIGYGDFIKAHRLKSGFKSQRKLAELTNISHSTISRIEKEIHKPDVESLKEIAKYLTSTSLVELMIVCGYWDKEDLLEDLPNSVEDIIRETNNNDSYLNKNIAKNEDEFIENIELTNEELLEKYDIRIDGESLSEEEANMFIASIRALRSMKKS